MTSYTVVRWDCAKCGRNCGEVRAPSKMATNWYMPVCCGFCGSTQFTERKDKP